MSWNPRSPNSRNAPERSFSAEDDFGPLLGPLADRIDSSRIRDSPTLPSRSRSPLFDRPESFVNQISNARRSSPYSRNPYLRSLYDSTRRSGYAHAPLKFGARQYDLNGSLVPSPLREGRSPDLRYVSRHDWPTSTSVIGQHLSQSHQTSPSSSSRPTELRTRYENPKEVDNRLIQVLLERSKNAKKRAASREKQEESDVDIRISAKRRRKESTSSSDQSEESEVLNGPMRPSAPPPVPLPVQKRLPVTAPVSYENANGISSAARFAERMAASHNASVTPLVTTGEPLATAPLDSLASIPVTGSADISKSVMSMTYRQNSGIGIVSSYSSSRRASLEHGNKVVKEAGKSPLAVSNGEVADPKLKETKAPEGSSPKPSTSGTEAVKLPVLPHRGVIRLPEDLRYFHSPLPEDDAVPEPTPSETKRTTPPLISAGRLGPIPVTFDRRGLTPSRGVMSNYVVQRALASARKSGYSSRVKQVMKKETPAFGKSEAIPSTPQLPKSLFQLQNEKDGEKATVLSLAPATPFQAAPATSLAPSAFTIPPPASTASSGFNPPMPPLKPAFVTVSTSTTTMISGVPATTSAFDASKTTETAPASTATTAATTSAAPSTASTAPSTSTFPAFNFTGPSTSSFGAPSTSAPVAVVSPASAAAATPIKPGSCLSALVGFKLPTTPVSSSTSTSLATSSSSPSIATTSTTTTTTSSSLPSAPAFTFGKSSDTDSSQPKPGLFGPTTSAASKPPAPSSSAAPTGLFGFPTSSTNATSSFSTGLTSTGLTFTSPTATTTAGSTLSGGFKFGATSPTPMSTAISSVQSPLGMPAPTTTMQAPAQPGTSTTSTFGFSAPPPGAFAFGQKNQAPSGGFQLSPPSGGFNFSASTAASTGATTTTTTAPPAFGFGSTSTAATAADTSKSLGIFSGVASTTAAPTFGFGNSAQGGATGGAAANQQQSGGVFAFGSKPPTAAPAFNFGQTSTAPKPAFNFGGAATTAPNSTGTTGTFGFGANSNPVPIAPFNFNAASNQPAQQPQQTGFGGFGTSAAASSPQGGFNFNAGSAQAPAAPSATSPQASSFQFGAAASSGLRPFGQSTGGGTFSFGAGSQGASAAPPAFNFGSGAAVSPSVGQQQQQPGGFNFGSAPTAPGQSFNFGAGASTAPVQFGAGYPGAQGASGFNMGTSSSAQRPTIKAKRRTRR